MTLVHEPIDLPAAPTDVERGASLDSGEHRTDRIEGHVLEVAPLQA
jgi:hypothetical protein